MTVQLDLGVPPALLPPRRRPVGHRPAEEPWITGPGHHLLIAELHRARAALDRLEATA